MLCQTAVINIQSSQIRNYFNARFKENMLFCFIFKTNQRLSAKKMTFEKLKKQKDHIDL